MSTPFTLRPDQLKAVEDLREAYRHGSNAPLLVAPTGFGKTVVFCYIASQMARAQRSVNILVHRAELIDQISRTLDSFSVSHAKISSGKPANDSLVTVSSVQTLVRQLDRHQAPHLAIIDEAHHAVEGNTWGKILTSWNCKRLGVTATPLRLSGEPLALFDTLVQGPTPAQLIHNGFLSPFKIFAPPTVDTSGLHRRAGEYVQSEVEAAVNKPKIVGDVIDHYRRLAHGKRFIAFCPSVKFAVELAAEFNRAGYRTSPVDGRMSDDARRQTIDDLRSGRIDGITSCNLVEEGFDVPAIECGILLAPTLSLGRFLQQVGRCLRPNEGKDVAIIIDHVGNTTRHGFPDEHREWSLAGKVSKQRSKDNGDSVRVCLKCYAAVPSGTQVCTQCGEAFPIKPRKISKEEGELIEMQRKQENRIVQARAETLEDLLAVAREKGRKPGWAYHVWAARQNRRARG
jgi:DNA repair protein RadD